MRQYVPNQGAGRPANIRYKGAPPLAENAEPEFDPYKAQIASKAANQYRRSGQVEDPFRSGAFG
jgi:hypothetical protein